MDIYLGKIIKLIIKIVLLARNFIKKQQNSRKMKKMPEKVLVDSANIEYKMIRWRGEKVPKKNHRNMGESW